MVTSLIPSTLVTTAFAADDPSAQASSQAGKTTVKLTNDWPTDLSADIIDVTVTNTIGPGSTLTVGSGKTLIFHGSGFISGGLANQTLVIVEKGGHLVLDDVTIQNNAVGSNGAIYVKQGGLLDLGYNDQKERRAPSVTSNTYNGAAKNIVIADVARVRLNNAATKKIGISYAGTVAAPVPLLEGGRYALTNDDLQYVVADDSKLGTTMELDTILLRYAKPQFLFLDTEAWFDIASGGIPEYALLNDWQKPVFTSAGAEVTDHTGNWQAAAKLTDAKVGDIMKYDVIMLCGFYRNSYTGAYNDGRKHDLNDIEYQLLEEFINHGGRVILQCEDASVLTPFHDYINPVGSQIAQRLGAGFEITNKPNGVQTSIDDTTDMHVKDVAPLTDNVHPWRVGFASPIICKTGVVSRTIFEAIASDGKYYSFCEDMQAGVRADGTKWGNIMALSDANLWTRAGALNAHYGTSDMITFAGNILGDSQSNRVYAALGYNPNNKQIDKQASTTTTTTTTTDYETVSKALGKVTDGQYTTLLRDHDLTPVSNELFFEESTLKYKEGTKYAGTEVFAKSAGVYIDITNDGSLNLHSGTVTVTPKDKNYVLTMNGTMDDAGTQITGGYQIKSADNYTLTVEDSTSPISAENGGTASVKASKVGQVFTVVEPDGETVTYTAKEKDEVIYLGRYRVVYAQDSTAQYTPSPKPTYASTFSQIFTPMTGYEMKGGSFRVALWDETAKDWKEINIEASDADSIAGEKTVWKSADGKVSVEQSYSKTGLSTGVTVTVNDVKQDIKIYTTDKAMVETNPNITLRGVGTDKTGQKLTDPLYELPTTMSYKDGKTTKPIESIPWEKYKLTGVKVGLSDDALVAQDLTDANGNKDADEALKTYTMLDLTQGSEIIVEFQYAWNWVDVTVKAVLDDGNDTPFPGFVPEIVEMEADKLGTVKAPNISGYEPDATSKTVTPSKMGNTQNVVTFKYKQALSKVIYKAVDEQGHELGTFDGPTIAKGEKPNLSAALAPKLTGYMVKTDINGAKLDGVPSSDQPFDGTTPITVTFTYVPRVKTVKVYMYEYDASKPDFKGTSLKFDETTYANMTTGQTLTISASAIAGYTVKEDANNEELRKTKSVFVSDDDTQQTVNFFYEKDTASQKYITVKLMDTSKNPNALIFSYKVPGIAGQAQVISAPTTLDGYVADGTNADVTIKPEENRGDGEGVVVFKFKPDVWTVTVKLMDNSIKPATEIAAKPTNFQDTYTVTKGKEISITAPSIYGYTLALDGQDNDLNGGTLKFTPTSNTEKTIYYESVENSSFVKHTVRFVDHADKELYSYNKMIPKGTGAGTKVEYKESDVKYLIPGYTLANISYKVAGNDATDAQVTNMVDAEITYKFDEATAKIIVEQYLGDPEHSGVKKEPDVELTGYRIGQQNIVVTAPARTDVALKDTLTKKVPGPLTATQTVKFEYEALDNIQFWLYDAETGKLITVLNGEGGKTYTAGQDILNLSGDHYTYKADDRASDDFKATGNGFVSTPVSGTDVKYSVYFQKATRQVTYIAMDSSKLSQDKFDTATPEQKETAKITGIQAAAMPAARVGETYMATAQTFDGWTLDDNLTKPYTVADGTGNLEVYFWYKAKATGTVTVKYVCGTEGGANNFTLASYTTKAAGGEKLTVTPPQNLGDGRYTLNAGQKEQVIDVTRDGQHEVSFYYTKNFVTVNTKIVLGTAQPSEITSQDVLKTGTADFYPPYRPGYKLVGVTGVDGGTVTKLPDGFKDKVTISNPQNDVELVWYYEQTDATEYQSVITVNYLYRGAALSKETFVKAFIGVDNTIDVPTFDGYTAKSYTFNNGASTDITDASKGITVKPTEKTATLTITYERKDGSIVLPGADGAYPAPDHDKDNVIVTPDDVNKPLVDNGDEGVKVPDDGTATVTRPTDKGKEDITVPGGSVVKPNGTIVLPKDPGSTGGGEEIHPDTKIPENLPAGYVAITYDSNNTAKEVKKEIGKKGVLAVKGSLFTDPDGANFVEWNDSGLGSGKPYAAGTTVDASVTLYAKWNAKYTYSATITYKPNGAQGQDVSYIVGHNTDKNLKTTLPSNLYQIPDWTFGGWNEAANGSGTLYQGDTDLNLTSGDTKELFAQWFKKNVDDSITVPGSDGNPNNPDTNATGNGNGTDKPSRNDKGEIEIPKGGSVTLPGGSVIGMPDGGKLLPDGTVIINRPDTNKDGKSDGTITIPGKDGTNPDVTDKDGKPENKKVFTLIYDINNGEDDEVLVKVVEGDAVSTIKNPFTWAGHIFLNWMREAGAKEYPAEATVENVTDREIFHAQWAKVNPDGSIELPGKDGILDGTDAATGTDHSKDNVTVTPADPNNGGKLTPQPDGSVKVEDNNGGTVNRPKDSNDLDAGREDIKVPNGTLVDPDGTIHLPDGSEIKPGNKLPDATPNGYVSVVYKANGGTGDDVIVVVKSTETINTIKNPFKKNGETFSGWNTAENGINGTAYGEGAEITGITGKSVTLYAQWTKSTAFKYSAKLIYLPNDGTREANKIEDTVGANDSQTFSENLRAANTFTVTGWTFGGWNTAANGSGDLKAANAVIEVTANVNQTFHAQWYKTNADGSITVPGKDGNPNTAGDNVTANGNGNPVTRDDATGNIEIPAGGSAITPNGEIALPDGGILKPDGTVIINLPDTNNNGKPDNTITVPGANGTDPDVKDENGNTDNTKTAVVLTYESNNGSGKEVKVYTVSGNATKALAKDTFTYSGHKFLYWQSGDATYKAAAEITPNGNMTLSAVWAKVNPDGSIELPGENGKLEAPHDKDNVIVTPDSKDGLEGPKDDGSVEVKPDHEATVTRPDPDPTKPDTKEDVKVPAGTVILPDGTIKLPAPDNTEIKPGDKIPEMTTAYVTVTFAPGTGTGSTIKQIVNKNSKINLLDESAFTAPDNHFFVGWKDADGKSYDAGVEYDVGTAAVTFTAQYQDRDDLTKAVAIFDYAGGTDAKGNGSKYVTGKADAAITGIADPTRTGYTFDGWGNADLKFGASGSVTEFTAQWTIKSYDVTFDVGDNTKGTMSGYTDPVTVEYGKSVASADIPSIAASAGNVFVGWLNSSDNSVYTADSLKNYVVTGNVTFTAQYADASLATVIFVYAGGTLNGEHSKLVSATEGSAIGTLPDPTRDGYTLTGWTPAIADNATFGAAGTVTVYTAEWDENEKQPFTVTFDIDATKGSTADTTTETVADGGFVTKVPTVTANAGYRFVGWKDQDNKLFYEAGLLLYPITKVTTFTAQFEEVTANPGTATVIFDANGGKIGNNSVLTKVGVPGAQVENIANPVRAGYTFVSWLDEQGDAVDAANIVYGAADTTATYTAKWEAIEYTIHFSATGTSGATADQTYKFDGTTKNTLNRNGFTLTGKDFLGWSLTDGATTAAFADGALINDTLRAALAASNGSITLYAVWADGVTNTLTVTGSKATAKRDETVDFTAYLNGVATNAVTWIVTGGQSGTHIDANGVLTIGSNESNGTVLTVTAIYKNDTSLTANATVRVVVNSNNNGGNNGGGTVSSSFVIKANAGNGGIISPSGNVSVKRGDDQTFVINPVNGYRIADVIVDGKSVGAVSLYTFENVRANHTIEVVFTKLNSIVADPTETGVAGWLQTREHIAYLGGYGNGLFGPNDNMTRAQVAQMFYNLLLEKDIPVTTSFSDVPADAWYAKAVNTLASLGIIKGIGNDQFAPNRTITRAEFTVIAMRFANVSATVTNPFSDIASSDWYYTAVTSAVSYGWITGYSDGTFKPMATITRAEVATIVNRMLARTADRTFVDSSAVTRFDDVPATYWAYYNIAEATTAHTHTIDNDGVESWGRLM